MSFTDKISVLPTLCYKNQSQATNTMPLDLANPDRAINVGIILTGGITELLDVAPIDLLHGLTPHFTRNLPLPDIVKAQAIEFAFHWITETGKPAVLTSGSAMQATHSFQNAPTLDIVLMGAHNMEHTLTQAEQAYIRKAHDECAAFLTICGGFLNALHTGLLQGKTATAPRFMVSQLKKDAPGVQWVEQRWVHDGKVWTTGALLCGPDMMRAFIEETWQNKAELVHIMLDIACCSHRSIKYED